MERGCFDAIFLADVLGPYDIYGGNRNVTLTNATHLPINDPMLRISHQVGSWPFLVMVYQNHEYGED